MAHDHDIERGNVKRLAARLTKIMDRDSAALILGEIGDGYRDYSEFIELTKFVAINAQTTALKQLAQRYEQGTADAILFGEAALDAAMDCIR